MVRNSTSRLRHVAQPIFSRSSSDSDGSDLLDILQEQQSWYEVAMAEIFMVGALRAKLVTLPTRSTLATMDVEAVRLSRATIDAWSQTATYSQFLNPDLRLFLSSSAFEGSGLCKKLY